MQRRGVLFDLDGTLLDTALDMGAVLNAMRVEKGLQPLPHTTIRPCVSKGAATLLELAFGPVPHTERTERIDRYLTLYRGHLAVETRMFDEVPALLQELERRGISWGVVTNKPSRLTEPLLEAMGLSARAGVIVSGDTYPERKPSPVPLLRAAEQLGVGSSECIYLGDAECDMQAARAAGMLALGARFGYFDESDRPGEWPADGWVDSPLGVLDWLNR